MFFARPRAPRTKARIDAEKPSESDSVLKQAIAVHDYGYTAPVTTPRDGRVSRANRHLRVHRRLRPYASLDTTMNRPSWARPGSEYRRQE